MKKIIAFALVLVLAVALMACGAEKNPDPTEAPADVTPTEDANNEAAVMTYAEYAAAEDDAPVVVECYVQAHQAWWDNKVTVYAADEDGAYFIYEMTCSQEDAEKLVPGAKIKVTGFKTSWEGEKEIASGATFEFVEGTYVAEAKDLTDKIADETLIDYQNQLAIFKGLTVKEMSKKDSESDPDIYVTFTKDGADYSFCVENYLTGPDTDLYKAVEALQAGDVVDVTGFVYWYKGLNAHITAVAAAQ